jgi:6-phospho-beta-glucosidase
MPGVFRGLLHRKTDLNGTEVVLYDIDPQHAGLMSRLGNRMAEAAGAGVRVETAPTLEAVIDGSDFIFTTFRPGGFRARHLDERLPLSRGIVGQETCGPGGFFMACRSVPILLHIAEVRDAVAPNAWIVNYTNPTSIVTAAVHRYAGGRILGLCDQNAVDSALWSQMLDIDLTGAEIDWVGTNHVTAAKSVRLRNEDITSAISRRLEELEPEQFPDTASQQLAWLGRRLGLLVNSYLRYYFFHDAVARQLQGQPTTRAEDILATLPRLYEDFRIQAEQPAPDPSRERGGGDHGEFAVDVMCAVAGDESTRYIMNTPNNGAISDLADDAVVEVSCRVDQNGAHTMPAGVLPRAVKGLIQAIAAYEDIAVDAAARGDRRLALQALMAHPFVREATEAAQLLDEGLRTHQEFLPQFTA